MATQDNTSIETVSLELLRPGPAHGQLLSPLTPYMALSGGESPITLNIQLEHWKLLNRLQRLRYLVDDGSGRGYAAVPEQMRESEILELGSEVGKILVQIPTLTGELGRAAGRLGQNINSGTGLVHLELILSGSELSLIPFELVISPEGYPGDAIAMLLQTRVPIMVTRRVRRDRDMTIKWGNRPPRVLFVAAAPEGLTVPQKAHLLAIRNALDPWVQWAPPSNKGQRIANLKKHLTVLLSASIEDVQRECAQNDYSHVHFLAHGDSYKEAGQPRYGMALCNDRERTRKVVVDGQRIAEALRAADNIGQRRSRPQVVTLATCDSGNVRTVAAPGASIAHDLHAFGIPWVIASQFPLTVPGSVRMAKKLYQGLFEGEDPRRLLHRLRSALHVSGHSDHDWASLVTYASVPEDPWRLDYDVGWFRSDQMRQAVNKELDQAWQLEGLEDRQGAEEAIGRAADWLRRWEEGLPAGDEENERNLRAECYGVNGAIRKQWAELFSKRKYEEKAQQELVRARHWYKRAMDLRPKSKTHWTATQYLSLTAVLDMDPDGVTWRGTFNWAKEDMLVESERDRAWAHGTLAELEMLRIFHDPESVKDLDGLKRGVVDHCLKIRRLVGDEDFAVFSTRRQFQRYCDWWTDDRWQSIAEAAVEALAPGKG